MKTTKLYDDVHTDLKVEAARSGRTTLNVGSELLKKALLMVKEGKWKISSLPKEEASTK